MGFYLGEEDNRRQKRLAKLVKESEVALKATEEIMAEIRYCGDESRRASDRAGARRRQAGRVQEKFPTYLPPVHNRGR